MDTNTLNQLGNVLNDMLRRDGIQAALANLALLNSFAQQLQAAQEAAKQSADAPQETSNG